MKQVKLTILIVATLLAVLFLPQAATASSGRHTPLAGAGFATFGTISTGGAVVDRFGVGNNVDALAFVPQNVGYGPNLFYFLRHDSGGFSTFGTISTSGAVVDRFGVGYHVDALSFAPQNVGYGPNLFYFLRHA